MQKNELVTKTEDIHNKLIAAMEENKTVIVFTNGVIDYSFEFKLEDVNEGIDIGDGINTFSINTDQIVHIAVEKEIDGDIYEIQLNNNNKIMILI